MNLSRPFAAVSPGVEADVLISLAGSTGSRTGREVARVSGRSVTGVQYALDRLVEEGLVHRGVAGRSYLYTLNRDHLLAAAVEVMAGVRWELVQRLRDSIQSWSIRTFHASLFGSAARGEGSASSDIDLLVVRPSHINAEDPAWRNQLDELADQVWLWTGNHAGLVELSHRDLFQTLEERPPVLEDVIEHGIDLAGAPIREWAKSR